MLHGNASHDEPKYRACPAVGVRRKRRETDQKKYGSCTKVRSHEPLFFLQKNKQKRAPAASLPRAVLAHLERLELLEHVADDSGGRRLVGVGHGPPARLGAERLAQPADAAAGAQVNLAGDRSYKTRQDTTKGGMRKETRATT